MTLSLDGNFVILFPDKGCPPMKQPMTELYALLLRDLGQIQHGSSIGESMQEPRSFKKEPSEDQERQRWQAAMSEYWSSKSVMPVSDFRQNGKNYKGCYKFVNRTTLTYAGPLPEQLDCRPPMNPSSKAPWSQGNGDLKPRQRRNRKRKHVSTKTISDAAFYTGISSHPPKTKQPRMSYNFQKYREVFRDMQYFHEM